MEKLYEIKLEHYSHMENRIYFEEDGTILYGVKGKHLVYPGVFEMKGLLSPFTLADLKAAFLAGKEAEKVLRDELEIDKYADIPFEGV